MSDSKTQMNSFHNIHIMNTIRMHKEANLNTSKSLAIANKRLQMPLNSYELYDLQMTIQHLKEHIKFRNGLIKRLQSQLVIC